MEEVKFSVDDQIRAYDFPLEDMENCYIEGQIVRVDPEEYPGCIELVCTFDSTANKEHSRVGDTIITPIQSEIDNIWKRKRLVILDNE